MNEKSWGGLMILAGFVLVPAGAFWIHPGLGIAMFGAVFFFMGLCLSLKYAGDQRKKEKERG